MNNTRTIRAGARLSTVTSTTLTVLLLASMGQGALSTALLAASGLGFELLKWSSWNDVWSAHNAGNPDRRNIMAILCAAAVILSIGASIATTRANLSVSAGDYLSVTQKRDLILKQINQKQQAIDVCTAANRITLCATPLQKEVTGLQLQLESLVIPQPDEATALIMEVKNITGLTFSQSATLVVTLISVMLDATGLYFLYLQLPAQTDIQAAHGTLPETHQDTPVSPSESPLPLHTPAHTTHIHGDVNLSVTLGVESTIRTAKTLIESGESRPSIRALSDKMNIPQHTAQTILCWLADAGHLQRLDGGRGYAPLQ